MMPRCLKGVETAEMVEKITLHRDLDITKTSLCFRFGGLFVKIG